ncbi:hypothetical protein H5410_001914 [Solanum commersonii]|uniref:Uncharacterized protein n=1 Tax=Solanum commersonii TaxID=4109 RepID=A0A9J6B059_SOLCO|nr:hypothetical protein H5410_001914 [Solanum commersonii]
MDYSRDDIDGLLNDQFRDVAQIFMALLMFILTRDARGRAFCACISSTSMLHVQDPYDQDRHYVMKI